MPIANFDPRELGSPIDRIAKAVDIASSIYGLPIKSAELEKLRAESAEKQRATDLASQMSDPNSDYSKQAQADLGSALGEFASKGVLSPDAAKSSLANLASRSGASIDKFKESPTFQLAMEQLKEKTALAREERKIDYASRKESEKAPTSAQSVAALYGTRMGESNKTIDDLMSGGFDPSSYSSGIKSVLPAMFQGAPQQKMEQAKKDFVNATLRRESGAAIAKSEFDSANKQYFPGAGDSPEVIAQKARNRQIAIAGLQSEAGDKALGLLQKKLPDAPKVAKKSKGKGKESSLNSAIAGPAPKKPEEMSDEELMKELGMK